MLRAAMAASRASLQRPGKFFVLFYSCKTISGKRISDYKSWLSVPLKACIARVSKWMQPRGRIPDRMQYFAFSSWLINQLSLCRPYHWVNDLESDPPIESRSNIQANIEGVHRSPEDLTTQLSNSRARAEAAVKSKDVTKVRTLAPEQLRPDVIAELHNKEALQLPARAICDELINAFFHWAAPLVPVLNKIEFLRSYQDPNNQPSLLLIQAVLAAGSTVAGGSNLTANPVAPVAVAATYFDRARTLYEANYETDPVTLVQSLILMGWYWEALDGAIHRDPMVSGTDF